MVFLPLAHASSIFLYVWYFCTPFHRCAAALGMHVSTSLFFWDVRLSWRGVSYLCRTAYRASASGAVTGSLLGFWLPVLFFCGAGAF